MNYYNKTIELVGYGHPDRFADYISEKILMVHLKHNKNAKVAIETMVTRDMIFLGGETSSNLHVDYKKLVFEAIEEVYGELWWPEYKESVKVIENIKKQSSELSFIQQQEVVAGDQGVIYGYYSKKRYGDIKFLYKLMENVRKEFNLSPDWKLLFNPILNELSMSLCGIDEEMYSLISSYIKSFYLNSTKKLNKLIINPAGEWLVGGPLSDTGVTGRKLMIDTFGAGIPHGGGAFCGKDFSKVDKTGVLIASELAYEYAKKHNKDEVLVELNYKIGDKYPEILINGENKINIGKTSLNEWINNSEVFKINWDKVVLKGGVVPYLYKKFKKGNK